VSSGRTLWTRLRTFGFHKRQGSCWSVKTASQERLISMELDAMRCRPCLLVTGSCSRLNAPLLITLILTVQQADGYLRTADGGSHYPGVRLVPGFGCKTYTCLCNTQEEDTSHIQTLLWYSQGTEWKKWFTIHEHTLHQTSVQSDEHSYIVFGRYLLRISARRPAILTEGFRGLPHYHQVTADMAQHHHQRFLLHPLQLQIAIIVSFDAT
jgi:hypothetical protein